MDIVYPVDLLRRLGGWNVEVYDNRLLVAPHHDAGKRFVPARKMPEEMLKHDNEVSSTAQTSPVPRCSMRALPSE
jgi:hypothetical protein